MEALFHCRETTDVEIDLLYRSATGLQKTGDPSRRDISGMLSKPVDVL